MLIAVLVIAYLVPHFPQYHFRLKSVIFLREEIQLFQDPSMWTDSIRQRARLSIKADNIMACN